jgi:hypothetical protein
LKIIYVSDAARKIMKQRGITLDAADAVPQTAEARLREFLKTKPHRFKNQCELERATQQELSLRNQVAVEFWAAKGNT